MRRSASVLVGDVVPLDFDLCAVGDGDTLTGREVAAGQVPMREWIPYRLSCRLARYA
jgi:hypothetical protein